MKSVGETDSTNPRLRVLVVDDYEDAADIVCLMLDLLGHEARAAHSGSDALELAREFDPHLVLLDIMLPDMSGHDVVRALRAHRGGELVHAVALTGYSRPEDRARAYEAGFDQYVIKPLDLAKVSRIIRRPAARRHRLSSAASCA